LCVCECVWGGEGGGGVCVIMSLLISVQADCIKANFRELFVANQRTAATH